MTEHLSLLEEKQAKLERLRQLRRLNVQAASHENRHFFRYRNDPVGFVVDILGEHPWSVQREIMESVVKNKYTSVRSCHASGKSFSAARVVCWFLSTRPIGEAFAVTTAPSYPQVKAILWREIHRAHNKAGLPGRLNLTEWLMGDELVAFGRKPADYDTEAFQGIHAREVLAILDEASGIPKNLWDAVETVLTNEHCRLLAIGNPDDPSSEFANTHKPDSGMNRIRIRAADTPNFTGEEVPPIVKESLIDVGWVEDKRKRWGEDSPLFVAKVLAEFPEDTTDMLFPLGVLNRATERNLAPSRPVEVAVDVARFGDDETVIGWRKGPVARIHSVTTKQDTMKTTARVIAVFEEIKASSIKVDEVGVGAGVADRLKQLGYPVVGLNAGRSASHRDPKTDEDVRKRFANARAQWFWGLRERLEAGHVDLDNDDELKEQLGNIKYEYTVTGKIQIESKDKMKERGMGSPDRADMMALLFAEPHETRRKAKLRAIRRW